MWSLKLVLTVSDCDDNDDDEDDNEPRCFCFCLEWCERRRNQIKVACDVCAEQARMCAWRWNVASLSPQLARVVGGDGQHKITNANNFFISLWSRDSRRRSFDIWWTHGNLMESSARTCSALIKLALDSGERYISHDLCANGNVNGWLESDWPISDTFYRDRKIAKWVFLRWSG